MAEAVRHVLSYGGGVNTVALMVLLVEEKAPLDEVLFADTGGEVPETYEYLEITKRYLDEHNIPFIVVENRKHGSQDLFANSWHRRVVPSALWRWSTRDFKVRPIHRYYRSLGVHVNQYMGIAYDEIERMKESRVSFISNLYPLVDRRITRSGCEEIIAKAGLPMPAKSGCFFCPFNSLERWKWLYEVHPSLFNRAIELEENSKHFPEQRLTDQVFRTKAKVTLRELRQSFDEGLEVLGDPLGTPCGGECMV